MRSYWFKAKKNGWGWTPATWQGWGILVLYIVSMIVIFYIVDQHSHSISDTLFTFLPLAGLLTVALILICYFTGENPQWFWGEKKQTDKE